MQTTSATSSSSLVASVTIAVPDVPASQLKDIAPALQRLPALASRGAAVTVNGQPGHLTVDVTVDVDAQAVPGTAAVLAGLDDAQRTARHITAATGELLGAGDRAALIALSVRAADAPTQRWRGQLRLVGLKEIAHKHGRTKQAADYLIARPDFPPPAVKVSAGSFWYEDEVDTYLQAFSERRAARGEQPPAVRVPNSGDRGRLADLLQEQQSASAVQLSAGLRQAVQEPAGLVGAPLAEAIDVLGGVPAVAAALGVDRSTVQRWRKGAQVQAAAHG